MKVANHTDNNFTIFRLLLAVLVVLGHFEAFAGIQSPPWPFNYAATAVDCFFVVSGYLVTTSFDRDPSLYRFYVRRFFRIYPLYLAVITVQSIILASLAHGGLIANARSIPSYLFFNAIFANFVQHDIGGVLTGLVDPSLNASLWTLKIEFGFYLLLPFLWRLVERMGAKAIIGIFILSAIYYDQVWNAGYHNFAKQLPGQLQYFVLGVAAYKYRDRLKLGRMPALFATIALAAAMTAMQRSHPIFIFPIVVAALVIIVTLFAPRVRMELDISYGVYLLHAPTIQLSLLYGLYRPDLTGLLATLAIVIVLALVVERLIESPGIDLGRRLSRRPGPPAGRADSPAPANSDTPPGIALPDMHVVILNDFCHAQGGASKVAIDEAISLADAGADVIFIGAVGPVCPELRQARLTVECLNQHELLSVTRHPSVVLQGIWNLKAAHATNAVLRRLPRERTVVHLHGYTKALTTSPVRIARGLGFQVVCTLHDFFAACPNGAFFDYAAGKPCEKRGLSASCVMKQCDKRSYTHKLFRVVRSLVQRYRGHFPAAVSDYISLSKRSAELLAPYLPPDARLYPLQNVVDVPADPPVEAERNHTILCIGRLDPEKGVLLVARQAHRLGLAVTFVGDGILRGEVEAIPGMTVTGWISSEAVQRHLDTARCLVFPSLWYETYGLVVSEAAARGVPAIVSDISAAAERVENGLTGWRFRNGDPADLARCLTLTWEDGLIRDTGRAAYRAFWANPETRDTHADNLVKIYRQAMRGSAA